MIDHMLTHRTQTPISEGEVHLRYEALFHNTLDGVFLYNYLKEEIIDCNKAAATILGFTDEKELIGKSRLEFEPRYDSAYPGVDIHEVAADNRNRAIKGESFSTMAVLHGFEGQRYLVKANIVPTFYEPGEAFLIIKDVTDEVLSKQALRKSKERYKDIYENSHEGIMYIDSKSLNIIMCNDKSLELFGANDIKSLRDIGEESIYFDDCYTAYSVKRLYVEFIRKALTEGRSTFSLWHSHAESELKRIEGVFVCDNSKSKTPKLIVFIRDVTELYETQNAINEKNEQLNTYIQSNLQLENFAHLASHDLQTPLRSIICFSQLLEKKIDSKLLPSEKELFNFIKISGERMREKIGQLLLFSKIDKEPFVRENIDINVLVNQVKLEMKEDVLIKGAKIKFNSTCKELTADRQKLKHVLTNLLSNALKFTREDVKPIIHLSCIEKPRHWLFSVEDNGIGIDQEYHDTIFTMFKKLHIEEEFSGSGFGLSMVKKIIELHNGSIWVESLMGHGTSIYFTIPKVK